MSPVQTAAYVSDMDLYKMVEAARFELASLTFEVRSFYMLSRYFGCPLQALTDPILKGELPVAFIKPAKSAPE